MYVSELTFGNWITHGSQVESDAAIKCVKTALDLGITTYDTADVYAGTKAESVLGKALKDINPSDRTAKMIVFFIIDFYCIIILLVEILLLLS